MTFLEIYPWHIWTPICVGVYLTACFLKVRYHKRILSYEMPYYVFMLVMTFVPFVQIGISFTIMVMSFFTWVFVLEAKYDIINRLTKLVNRIHKEKV